MQVTVNDFIKSPSFYLEQAAEKSIHIVKEDEVIAVLTKPSQIPITDSLLGILSDADIKDKSDIKAMRLGL